MPPTDDETRETTDMLLRAAHFLVDIECQSPATTRYECCALHEQSPRGARHVAVALAACATYRIRAYMKHVRGQGRHGHTTFEIIGMDDRRMDPDDAHPVAAVVVRMLDRTAESDMDGAYAALDDFLTDRATLLPDVLTVLTRAAHAEAHA